MQAARIMTLLLLLSSVTLAADWPGWRGADRQAVSGETGLLKEWPPEGPPLLWEMRGLGTGFSSVAIVGGRLYTMGDLDLDGKKSQYVLAFDLATRERLWTARVGGPHGDGPRCTPTVDDGRVHVVGTDGDVVCVEAATGREVWRKNLRKDLGGGGNPGWRFSESPLVDGDAVVCTPGGKDAILAKLDKRTGETIWKCSLPESERGGNVQAQYASVIVAELAGVRQYLTLLSGKGLVSAAAGDGKFLWCYPRVANGTANIATSVAWGDEVFCSTAYGAGSALLRVAASGGDDPGAGVKVEEVYFLDADTFQSHHGGFLRVGDHVFGGHGQNAGRPTCIEWKTGKVKWQARQPGGGSGAVLHADGRLYYRYDDNTVALIEANPEEYKLVSTFKLPKKPEGMGGPGWAHPVVLDGKLYLRHNDWLFCYDVKAK